MTFRFVPGAERGLNECAERYESERPGLGARFVREALRSVGLAASSPRAGRRVRGGEGLRRWNLERFPYSFLYAEEPGGIVVVAVVHHRRRPGAWRDDTSDE